MLEFPFDNPDLPSYQSPTYKDLLPKWELVADMFEGRSAWVNISGADGTYTLTDPIKANRYLPPENQEPSEEYFKRLSRSYFERRFRHAIESFAGLLSNFTMAPDTSESILDNIENVDLKGNNLEVFLREADVKALRDEHCFILVEFPKRPAEISNALEERQYNLRPYLVLIDTRDVLNWELGSDRRTLERVVIRERVWQPKGLFGSELKTRFRILMRGSYTLVEIQKETMVLIEEGFVSLPEIPLVPYSVAINDADPFCGEPPLYDLAELNLKHYQKVSEKDEVMHKCNIPVLQIQEMDGKGQSNTEVVQIGPNTCLWNVNASYIEPSGAALSATQADIEKLEQTMSDRTAAFLSGREVSRTATEVFHAATPVQANLGGMARAKESAVQKVFQLWSAYTGEPQFGGIVIDKKLLQSEMDGTRLSSLLQIKSQGEISAKTFLELLKEGKVLPKDFDVDQEIAELEAQRVADTQAFALKIEDIAAGKQ